MSYLCNVFFIVLDLRLTRLVYGGTPFFFALISRVYEVFAIAEGCGSADMTPSDTRKK